MQHLDEGTIHAWLDGALSGDESLRIERHVAECAECASAVAEARGLIAGASRIVSSLDVVRGNVIPKQPAAGATKRSLWRSLRLTPGRAAIAASLMVAAATALTVRGVAPDAALKEQVVRPSASADQPALAPPFVAAVRGAAAPVAALSKDSFSTTNTPARKEKRAAEPAASPPAVARATDARADVAMSDKVAAAPKPAAPAVQSVVTTAAAAPASAPAPLVDSSARRRASDTAVALDRIAQRALNTGRVAGASPAAGFASGVSQASEMSAKAAGLGSDEVTGCYALKADSVARLADRPLPQRFALEQTPGPNGRNVVRAVTPDGKVDSVIAGMRWERGSNNVANLYWTQTAGADQPPMLRLRLRSGPPAAQAATPAGTGVEVVRAACRP